MNKLATLKKQLNIVELGQILQKKSRKKFLKKEKVSLRSFYRFCRAEGSIKRQIQFEEEWRLLLEEHLQKFTQRPIEDATEEALSFIQNHFENMHPKYKVSKRDIKEELKSLFQEQNIEKKRKNKIKDIDVNLLERLYKNNPHLEEFRTQYNLQDFEIERAFGLGYISPFKYSSESTDKPPFRLRLDLVVLKGPWRDVTDGKGSFLMEFNKKINDEFKQLFLPINIGKPTTHKTGVILLVLNPCFIEVQSALSSDKTVMLPTKTIPLVDINTHQPKNNGWHIKRDLSLSSLEKRLELFQIFDSQKNTPINVPSDAIEPTSPFHPDNIKQTLERDFEFIITLQQRITSWMTIENLQNDKIHSFPDLNTIFEKMINPYELKLSFPDENFQNYWEQFYKRGLRRESHNIHLSLDRRKFDNDLDAYKKLGFKTKFILLSELFNFSTEGDIMMMLNSKIIRNIPEYLQKRSELRSINYKGEPSFPFFEPSPGFNTDYEYSTENLGFGYIRFRILDRKILPKLFELGIYLLEDKAELYMDIYGKLPSVSLQNISERQIKLFIKKLQSNFDDNILENLEIIQNENQLHFRYICSNPEYWTIEQYQNLRTKEQIEQEF